MRDVSVKLNLSASDEAPDTDRGGPRVGYVEGAIGGAERVISLAALFPQVEFVSVGAVWPDRVAAKLAALIVGAEAGDVEGVLKRLSGRRGGAPVIVALSDADVTTSRRLMRAGAADILPAPVSEAGPALSLEPVLARGHSATPSAPHLPV